MSELEFESKSDQFELQLLKSFGASDCRSFQWAIFFACQPPLQASLRMNLSRLMSDLYEYSRAFF